MSKEKWALIKFKGGNWAYVKLNELKHGDLPKRTKKAKCKKGDEVCVFKSEIALIKKSKTAHISFGRNGNEPTYTKLKEFAAVIEIDPEDEKGRIDEVFIYLSEQDDGKDVNVFNKNDVGLKLKDVQVIEPTQETDRYYVTLGATDLDAVNN
jgi:hypothetical protein